MGPRKRSAPIYSRNNNGYQIGARTEIATIGDETRRDETINFVLLLI